MTATINIFVQFRVPEIGQQLPSQDGAKAEIFSLPFVNDFEQGHYQYQIFAELLRDRK